MSITPPGQPAEQKPDNKNKFGPAMEMMMKAMAASQPQAMGGMPMMPQMPMQQMPMAPMQTPNLANRKLGRGMNPMMGLLGGGM